MKVFSAKAAFKMSTEFREDSQTNFAMGNIFCMFRGGGGGCLHKNVSQMLAIIDFF